MFWNSIINLLFHTRFALVPFLRWLEVLAAKKLEGERYSFMEMGWRWILLMKF